MSMIILKFKWTMRWLWLSLVWLKWLVYSCDRFILVVIWTCICFSTSTDNGRLPAEMKKNQIEENTKLMDINPSLETKLKINWKPNKDASSFKDYFASTSRGNNLKENRMVAFHNVVNRQISEVQKRIFDAIIRLRLSRTDIVKWVDLS